MGPAARLRVRQRPSHEHAPVQGCAGTPLHEAAFALRPCWK